MGRELVVTVDINPSVEAIRTAWFAFGVGGEMDSRQWTRYFTGHHLAWTPIIISDGLKLGAMIWFTDWDRENRMAQMHYHGQITAHPSKVMEEAIIALWGICRNAPLDVVLGIFPRDNLLARRMAERVGFKMFASTPDLCYTAFEYNNGD